jgi:hypothetical protein
VVAALAVYQVALMAVGYGKLRPPFLGAGEASFAHRALGGTIVAVTVVVAVMCLSYFEWGEGAVHAIAGALLLAVVALKIVVLRWWRAMDRFLPLLGITVLVLFALTWASSAGDFLAGGTE